MPKFIHVNFSKYRRRKKISVNLIKIAFIKSVFLYKSTNKNAGGYHRKHLKPKYWSKIENSDSLSDSVHSDFEHINHFLHAFALPALG